MLEEPTPFFIHCRKMMLLWLYITNVLRRTLWSVCWLMTIVFLFSALSNDWVHHCLREKHMTQDPEKAVSRYPNIGFLFCPFIFSLIVIFWYYVHHLIRNKYASWYNGPIEFGIIRLTRDYLCQLSWNLVFYWLQSIYRFIGRLLWKN